MGCLFCEIAKKRRACNIVYEDDLIIGFMDIDPINEGHVLLITREHRLDLDELTQEERYRIMDVSNLMLKGLKKTYRMDGYSVMQNGGEFNDIGHYHYHIFPRYQGDGFGWTANGISKRDLKEVSKKLIAEVNSLIKNN